MSTLAPVTSSPALTGVMVNPSGSVMDRAFAVLVMRYQSHMSDLDAQMRALDQAGATKRLWNDQLARLNQLMQRIAAAGKGSGEAVDLYLTPEEMPYKNYKVVTSADGVVTLEPTDTTAANRLTDACTPIFGAPGTAPAAAAATYDALEQQISDLQRSLARAPSQGIDFARHIEAQLAPLRARLTQLRAHVVGYRLSLTAEAVKAQIENVRGAIDSLNTTNDIEMLRLNDSYGKANLIMEQLSKLLAGAHDTQSKLLANFR